MANQPISPILPSARTADMLKKKYKKSPLPIGNSSRNKHANRKKKNDRKGIVDTYA